MKKFHDALKNIYGPKSSGATTYLSADGITLLADKEAILKRRTEHIYSVLNRPSSIRQTSTDRVQCSVRRISNRHGNKKSCSTSVI